MSSKAMRTLIVLPCVCVLTACAVTKTELQSASTSLTPSVMAIEREQVLQNIGRFIGHCTRPADSDWTSIKPPVAPNATDAKVLAIALSYKISCSEVPSQVVLGGGQAQVSNTLALPNSTTINFQGIALKALGLQNSNQWVQTWSITPVTDFGDLQRLTLLYGYSVLLSDNEAVDDTSVLVKSFATSWVYSPINLGSQTN